MTTSTTPAVVAEGLTRARDWAELFREIFEEPASRLTPQSLGDQPCFRAPTFRSPPVVDDAKEIVGKLTEAQRVILLGARPADSFEYWTSAPICAPPLTGLDCVLNPLGVKVRALLHKEQCDG